MTEFTLTSSQIDAVVFDVIGTLVDDDRAWADVAERLAAEAGVPPTAGLYRLWVDLLNEDLEAVVAGAARWRPHQECVTDSARRAIIRAGGTPSPAALTLVRSLDSKYQAWADVTSATAALRRDRLVVGLSNADLGALARLAHANTINWDIAVSTGTAHTFKPAPAAYQYAIGALAIDPTRTLFVAAHPWDLRAASQHGFRTAYIGRPSAERPAANDQFDVVVDDLSALLKVLDSAAQ